MHRRTLLSSGIGMAAALEFFRHFQGFAIMAAEAGEHRVFRHYALALAA